MADEIKLKAPTVEQQVVVNINGEDKLKSFADTLDKISNNKNLQKYWKTQQDLINATADAYSNFQKKASKDNASELIKVTNALKAMSGTDLSHILPDFDKISKSMTEAQKVAGNIDSAFSVKGFKEAFDSFETLKAYGTDVQKLFSHFGVSSDISELQQNVRLLEREVEKLTRRLGNARNANEELRNELENFKVGSGFADKLDELDRLKAEMQNIRDEATQTFNQFLDANKIDRYDWFSDDRFAEYFEKLENGTLTATDAIRRFKSEYSYLLEDSYKSSGDSFGLDQLQAFSTKLDSIFHQVEETSNKINDIISNGVIAKSVQNLSEDTAISDSQRSIFGNILQDEESLKSITALFQKLIDETNQTKNTKVFNTEQFTKIESLFTSIESSLSSIKGILVDVGDGEELSPLLKSIANVESGIDKLSSSVKGIGLNMNIDFGSDTEMEAKVQAKISNALQAYQRLFDHIKSLSAGGSLITQKFFDFDINQFDTPMSKLQAYKKFIENMRNETKSQFNGKDILYSETDKKYWSQASSAMGQVTKAFNEMKASTNTNPLENIFGKTDLTEVIEQLNTIVSKLDEISVSAKGFVETFKNGLNVNASVDEIEKLTNRVKELESELAKIKTPTTVTTPQESNISLENNSRKDAFPSTEIKLDEAVTSAKDLDKTLEQVDIPTDSFDKVLEKLDRTKSELVDIVKITKQSVFDADGKFHDSYTLKDSRGSTEIYGVSSKTDKGQILRQNIVGYDVKKDTVDNSKELLAIEKQLQKEIKASDKANQKKFQDFQKEQANYEESVNKVNSTIQKTDEILDTLPLHDKLDGQFLDMIDSVDNLNSKLKSGELTLSEYKNEVKSVTSEYSKMVSIQQKRDVEDYNANAKANLENTKNIQAEWDKNIKAIQDYMDAVTKLNNLKAKDKGTGSEANQIELQTQNVEKLKQIAFEARQNLSSMQAENPDIIAWKQWVDMMELFDQASKGSAESAAKLKDVLDNIKAPSLDKYENKLSSYQTKKAGYDATIARFNDGGWTSDEYLRNVQAVKDAVKKYEDLLNNIKAKGGIASEDDVQNLKEYESEIKKTISTVTNMSASEKGYNFVSGQKELDKIHKLLNENSKMSSEAKAKIRAYYTEIESGNPSMSLDKIHGEIMKIYNAEVEAGRAGRSFFDTLKNSGFHQIAAQMAGMFGVYDVINVVKEGINTVRELDTAMTEVRKVSNATETQYASFRDTISSTAKEIATTNKELLNSSANFLRLGYSLDQASDLAKNATLFVNVGDGVDITEATEDMITAMKAFDIQAEDSIKIVDDYNKIGNEYALSATDIGEAMKRSASALEVGNNSFEESIGLITAMNEIVQNSENTGNSLKVLSLRLRGAKAELEDMGEDTDGLCDSTSKLREQVKALSGVDIMEDDNTFKSTAQQVKELGEAFVKLDDVSQAALLEIIAGKSRSNAVAALLKNYQKIDNVIADLADAEGSALRENEAIVDSIDGRIKVLSATAEDFWQKSINTDFVKNIVSSLDTILNLLTKIIDQFGLLPTIIGVGGTGTGIFKFIKNFDWVFKPYIRLSNSFYLVNHR